MTHLLTSVEAAACLNVDQRRLLRMRRRGEIAAVNVGTARRPEWRWTPAMLDAWLRARTVKAVA